MLDKIFSIKREENILHINFLGIRIKRKGNYNNRIYVIDENSNKKRVRKIKGVQVIFRGNDSTVTIHKPIPRFTDSKIILGNHNNVEIGSSPYKINSLKIIATKNYCNVNIANDCSAKNTLAILCNSESHKTVSIGKDCMFGSFIMIRTGDVHTIYDKDYQVLNYGGDVTIKDNVWLGYGVTVLKNVTIEKGCIVGTHAVVTKNLDKPHSIYAGTPAKFIKENVYWSRFAIEKFQKKLDKNEIKNQYIEQNDEDMTEVLL